MKIMQFLSTPVVKHCFQSTPCFTTHSGKLLQAFCYRDTAMIYNQILTLHDALLVRPTFLA